MLRKDICIFSAFNPVGCQKKKNNFQETQKALISFYWSVGVWSSAYPRHRAVTTIAIMTVPSSNKRERFCSRLNPGETSATDLDEHLH